MSSRALRKVQRELEQQKQAEVSKDEGAAGLDGSEDETVSAPKAVNAFDMLNDDEEQGAQENSVDDDSDTYGEHSKVKQEETQPEAAGTSKPRTKSKKKKNKKKVKNNGSVTDSGHQSQVAGKAPQLDEIDLALQSLSTTAAEDDASVPTRVKIDEANLQLYRLLAVESRHLNALNEMKRLFGNVAMENEDEAAGTPRRRGRGAQQLDLGGALAGRNSPASRGQGLAGLALRRNPFILGKEEWPKATGGGLGMELVEKLEDGTVEYRFVHNTIYQDVQRQFEVCVESMDPQRMISLLQYNPYHISTLLQVSEIAKQQGDHSVSGDLLERALFSFGRSVHSSFTAALTEGKARLDFRRPENREFWLAAWRYMGNLGQRGTWRTAYEWAKLILSLDPEGDPYCISLVIDQLALRGGQSEHLLELSKCPFFSDDLWVTRVNIQVSSALAEYKLKQPQKSRETLAKCIAKFPWMFARLFQALNIDHIPRSIWGKTPNTDRGKFECEVYVHNAKDLWNTPEIVSLLVEVAESIGHPSQDSASSATELTLDEARHVLLSGVPTLINLIPRDYTTRSTSSSDPLPPSDNLPSYDPTPPTDHHREYASPFEAADGIETPPEEGTDGTPNPRSREDHGPDVTPGQNTQGLTAFIRRLMPRFAGAGSTPDASQSEDARQEDESAEQNALSGLTPEQRARFAEVLDAAARGRRDQANPHQTDTNNIEGAASSHAARVEDATDEADSSTQPIETTAPHIGPPEPYDDERNQRWLAGQGMLRLKDFTTQYGTNESAWPADDERSIVTEYARRMLQLRQQRSRKFLMDFTLRQGTSVEVKELVAREIQRLS